MAPCIFRAGVFAVMLSGAADDPKPVPGGDFGRSRRPPTESVRVTLLSNIAGSSFPVCEYGYTLTVEETTIACRYACQLLMR
jgi:hypothetical protein